VEWGTRKINKSSLGGRAGARANAFLAALGRQGGGGGGSSGAERGRTDDAKRVHWNKRADDDGSKVEMSFEKGW
jgi:hypothetical protein